MRRGGLMGSDGESQYSEEKKYGVGGGCGKSTNYGPVEEEENQ